MSQLEPARVSVVIGGRFHAFDLARELARHGVLHRLVTSYPRSHPRAFGVPDEHVRSLPLIALQRTLERFFPRHAPRAYNALNVTFGAIAAHQLTGSNVIHGWSGYSLASLRWAQRHGIRTVIERSSSHISTQLEILEAEHRLYGLPFDRGASLWTARDLEEYELADLIVVPSLFARRSFLERGFAESRIVYAPFGASLQNFAPGAKRDRVFRVLYCGQLGVRKGIAYLVDAFERAGIARGELCLVGTAMPETPRLMRGAGDRVKCLGHLPQGELAELYRNASVFAIASVEEGLAVVQAQAMASGLPLVCTTNTGGEDLLMASGALVARHEGGIDEYPAGYVVPVRDAEAMSRCLRWLADDADLLQAKREAARAIRDVALSWEHYAQRVLDGYARLGFGAVRSEGVD